MARLFPVLGAAGAVLVLATACASSPAALPASPTVAPATSGAISAGQLRSYLTAVEAVRLPVNQLLSQADPILDAYHDHRITPAVAAARMGAMEQEFGALAVEMGTIRPRLADGNLDSLPDTQNAQRQAIVAWRIAIEVAAARVGLTLPADASQAGRGEIAPGLDGS